MALTDENSNGMVMPVAPMGGYGNGGGFGGDWSSWIVLFLLFGMFGGWGNGWGGMNGMGGFAADGAVLYPWMNQSNQINNGFRDQMINSSINGIQSAITSGFGDTALGIAGINQNICQTGNGITNAMNAGFAGTTAAITGAQNAIAQQMYGNEIASLNRSFAEQTANMQGFNGLNTGVADLRYTVATEACADRAAVGDALQNVTMQNLGNTNQIVTAINAGIQSIKDDLCADRLAASQRETEAERRENANLRSQLSMAQLAASQAAQTAVFQQGLNNEVDALYNRLKNCPVNTVPVFGNQPIFTCPTNVGNNSPCGCGGF